MSQGRKEGMLHGGNGCGLHSDCLTCPGPDCCIWPLGTDHKKQVEVLKAWGPYFKKQREMVILSAPVSYN